MAAEGLLERGDGRWHLSANADLPALLAAATFPTGLLEVMRRRLGTLSRDARAALDVAAVLGRAFDLHAVEKTGTMEGSACLRALTEASDGQFISDLGAGRYAFLHDKIRETVYGELSADRRRTLHAGAAHALEVSSTDAVDGGRCAELAHHFHLAGDVHRAIDYLERAGEHALRLSSDGDGARYFRDALDLEATLPARLPLESRISWQRQIGEAMQAVGRVEESIVPLAKAASLAGHPVPDGKISLALGVLAQVVRQVVRRNLPIAPKAAARPGVMLEAGRTYDALQRAYFYSGQGPELIFANLRCVNVLEAVALSPELSVAYGLAGVTASFAHPSLGATYYRLALDAIGKCNNPSSESHIHLLLGLHFMSLGQCGEAIRHSELAIDLADRVGYLRRRDECLAVRAAVDIVAGRHAAPWPWLERLASSASRRQDKHLLSWSQFQQAQCLLLRDDVAAARARLDSVQPFLPELGRTDEILVRLTPSVGGDERASSRRGT